MPAHLFLTPLSTRVKLVQMAFAADGRWIAAAAELDYRGPSYRSDGSL